MSLDPPPKTGSPLRRRGFFAPPSPASAEPVPVQAAGLTVVSLAAAVALLYYGRLFFITVIFALFLSFAMRPFISLLERARVPRVLAILLLLFVLVGAMVLLFVNVTAQLNEFYVDLPALPAPHQGAPVPADGVRQHAAGEDGQHPSGGRPRRARGQDRRVALEATRALVSQVGDVLHLVLYAMAVPFLTFFMLKDGEKFGRVISGILSRNPRMAGTDVTGAVSHTMTSYALGLVFVMAIMAGATTISLMILGVRYYYILGPIAGLAIMLARTSA